MGELGFVFQGAALVLPDGVADSGMGRLVPLGAAAGLAGADCFAVPALEGSGAVAVVSLGAGCALPAGWRAVPVRQALAALCGDAGGFDPASPDGAVNCLFRAFHVAQWRRESRFCGSCGGVNADAAGELARVCPVCGRVEFPRIAPAVITLITDGEGRALLAHNKKFAPGVYSLIAGFNEAGESLEATVARETREEVNVDVSGIRYITSQPWPFPCSLMLGFAASYAGGEIRPDGIEIEDARWFGRDELPKLPGSGSVSRYLINRWLAGDW